MATPQDIADVKNSASVFIIFGATGDLAKRKIFPSFWELSKNGFLPDKFKIIASARTKFATPDFLKNLKESLDDVKDKKAWELFSSKIEYIASDVDQSVGLENIESATQEFENHTNICSQQILYLAISPFIIEQAIENLGKSKLNLGCQKHGKHARVVIEKPFGFDLKSAINLDEKLHKYFTETQIYRIDHFLGKETVQNIFAFRFGNELFEPVWNNQYIDHVQITAAEHIGIEKRGEYYDKVGALRDVTQNHLLQLLSLVTMEAPEKFDHAHIRNKKLAIVQNIKRQRTDEIIKSGVRGQYDGYLKEEKIDPKSTTETYAMVKLEIENNRWHGVPFYLRTGKKLTGKVSSIIFSFKEKGHKFFENFWERPMPNHITLQIQPNEGIGIRLVAKKQGLTTSLEPVDMEFCYKTSFDVAQPEAYERLLLDVILGDQSLFISQQEVEASWRIIDPIR